MRTDAELAAAITYVRSHFGNNSSAVTPEEVAHERAATASRAAPWTIAELNKP
jgi:mono/diheme cytochrome c family protein